MTTYLFEETKFIHAHSGNNKNIYISDQLLTKIANKWNLHDICNNIRDTGKDKLFIDRISDIQPKILNDAKILENGDILYNNLFYRTTHHENDNIQINKDENINNNRCDDVICLSGKWSSDVFHFPFEFLCGLRMVNNYMDKKIHVKKNNYVCQWLGLCGIKQENIICGNVYASNVIVPCFPFCGNPSVRDIFWLKNIIYNNITKQPQQTYALSNIILVCRNKSRTIKNYEEIKNCVELYAINEGLNLIIHDDNELSDLKSQLQYFHEAAIVITPHGGSEINLLACKNNTNIIELMDIEYTNICFARIAYYLNLNYYAIETVDFFLNIDVLRSILKKISLK